MFGQVQTEYSVNQMFGHKGNLLQNMLIHKRGEIGHTNFKKGFQKNMFDLCRISYVLVPGTISSLNVQSKVGMAPFTVQNKVCIAPFHVRSKVSKFALLMEGSHADFAPHKDRRHSFREQKIAEIAISANFNNLPLKPPISLDLIQPLCQLLIIKIF